MNSAAASATPAASAPLGRVWGWATAAVILLIYFAWAGSNPGTWPKNLTLWTYSKSGWIIPSRGLGQLLLAAALLYAILCGLACRARDALSTSGLTRWIAAILIFVVAIEIRFILLRAWWPVDFNGLAANGPAAWRIATIFADMLTLTLLLGALAARRQSLWLAALFGWHPLVLLAGPIAGNWSACVLPLIVLAALPWRWHRWMRELLILTPAALAVWWVAHTSLSGTAAANGLLASCLRDLGIEGRLQSQILIALATLLETLVVLLAIKRRWEMPRLWIHVLVICLLLSPTIGYPLLLPLATLAPLCFVASGWIVTGTALGLFLLKPAGGITQGEWLLFLIYVPVWVVEMGDITVSATTRFRPEALPETSQPATRSQS